MQDTVQRDNGECLRFLDPVTRSGLKHLRRTISDLDYLDLQLSADYGSCDDHIESKEREFHSKRHIMDGTTTCASPSWTTTPGDIISEESSLPPYYDHCEYLSSQKGLQAAADARNALMELIEKMPESSHELSFNVFVKEEQGMEESLEVKLEEKPLWKSKGEIEQKKKNGWPKLLSPTDSDVSGNFFLKVSLPVSLASKMKPQGSCSSLPRVPLRKGSGKPEKREWWKMLCSSLSEVSISDTDRRSSSTGSSKSTNSSSGWSERSLVPRRGYLSSRKFGCLF